MKTSIILIIILFLLWLLMIVSLAQETYQVSDNISFTILENGDWEVMAYGIGYLFHWLTPDLMKVEGSDNSCWYVFQREDGETMTTNDCSLVEFSKLLYRME